MKQDKSQLKIGIVLSYVNMLVGNLIPFFYTPVMLSLLGQSEYGLYKLSSSVTSYLSLISLGIGSAVTRYLIKAREEDGKEAEAHVFGLFMIVFQVIAVISFIVGAVIVCNLDSWYGKALSASELSRMQILVSLMVCNTALSFSQSPYIAVVGTHEKFVFQQLMNILTTCAAPMINIIMLLMGYASIGMAVSSLLISVLVRIAYTLYVRRIINIRPIYSDMPISMLREILAFSFWIFLSNVVGQLYNATDTVMMGAIPTLATTGVAVYSIGGVFNNIAFNLTTGVSNLLSPKVNKMVFSGAKDSELTDLAVRIGRIQGMIFALIVSGFVAFGRQFISFYAGEGYEDAYWVAICLMIPNSIPLVQSICLNVAIAQNKHKFRSLVYLGIALLNVIGTWFLMQIMGVIGAALMTGLALLIGQGLIMNWYYHKKTGLDMIRFWKSVGKVYIAPVAMCGAVVMLSSFIDFYNLITLFVGIVVYTVVYCAIEWCTTMTNYEKEILIQPLRKLCNRQCK